ncbi:MAG: site-specific DNA-methyltransferase [Thermoplasmata archaeon]|nr:site-specific DNA-methyltransferase [Thermoplasmata archaeon]
MPTLNWIGRERIINHHKDVPYCVLNRKYSFDSAGQHEEDNSSENMVIHGDNLYVLKSLLPKYEGKIDCIYIDPPYNTGNEKWVYNDNVNDPQILKWLGQVVGKDGEDLSRHDKWLCMMYPRLKLLQKLLSEKGVIFISIDDNELYNLKSICDEIFGQNKFVSNISWQRTYSPRNDSKGIAVEVEHILVYSKGFWSPKKLPRTDEMNKGYKSPDKDPDLWTSGDAFAPGSADHQGMVYGVQHPFTGTMIYPYGGSHWRLDQKKVLEIMNQWCPYKFEDIHDYSERAKVCGISTDEVRRDVEALVLALPVEESRALFLKRYNEGVWPTLYFTNGGCGGIRRKKHLTDVSGRLPTNLWLYQDVGHTDESKKEINAILGSNVFDTPKPVRLITQILKIATDKDSIVLDSFAGSGTTAHAVMKLNSEDGGNRRYICVEMLDYAETITAKRIKTVIEGYEQNEGIPSSFTFYEIGCELLKNDLINEEVDEESIRQFVFYTETKSAYAPVCDSKYYLGSKDSVAYYFCYEKEKSVALNNELLKTIKGGFDSYVIYADVCYLPDDYLKKNNIIFKKIPRDLGRF